MGFFGRFIGHVLTPIRTLFYWIGRAIPGLSKLPTISLPMRVAIMAFILLLILVIAGFIHFQYQPDIADTWHWVKLQLWILCAATIVIPVTSYFLVKLLMEGEKSRFPDIDHAWNTGIEAMAHHGINLSNTPIFLVLGSPTHDYAWSIMSATRIGMNVRGQPDGPARLHWYANENSIFLFLTECSCISRLTHNADHGEIGGPAATPVAPNSAPTGTIVAGQGGFEPASENITGTITADSGRTAPQPVPQAPASSAAMGTLQLPGNQSVTDFVPASGAAPPANAANAAVSTPEANTLTARLEYVCNLLNKERQPVCPINGVLTLLPFHLIANSATQLQTMIQRDLGTLRNSLKLRCANTALVTHMDNEEGFQELVRRVGMQRSKDQRFGKGHQTWGDPTDEQLAAIAQHAGGSFEDWTYMLFQEQDGLNKKYNSRLFSLLCKIRGGFIDSLEDVLVEGFGYNFDRNPQLAKQQFLFSGCYFGATGKTDDRQAFVRSVIQKVMEQENELEWTELALKDDDRNLSLANFAAFIGAISLVALVTMLLIDFGFISPFWKS
ncbi:MAG: hypothetical protein ACI9G1_001555 [Pirellulaceae bacterium]|jgi:hypothetical protein